MQITLDSRLVCDLELLLNGGFYPLTGFLNQKDYQSVVNDMRLDNGQLWPVPIVLPITEDQSKSLNTGDKVILTDETNLHLATLTVEETYLPDLHHECQQVYGDDNHPYTKIVKQRVEQQGKIYYLAGAVQKIHDVPHADFHKHRYTPQQTKQYFEQHGWNNVVAFQTRNPMHRSHFELTQYALKMAGENSRLLLQPIVGVTQTSDIDYFTRVKCYIKLLNYYNNNQVLLSLLPLSMRMAGPREALWHALIRQNFGANHFVVGRDHAGPSCKNLNGESFYGPYDAHNLLESVESELQINVIKSKLIVFVSDTNSYSPIDEVSDQHRDSIKNISGTQLREMIRTNQTIPDWFTFPDIASELKNSQPRRNGLCVYIVGLCGSGKTTVANYLSNELREYLPGSRAITILDGDIVRRNLSKGLGFSREDRSINVRRIGYVAAEIVKHGGVVICANIAPYADDREHNRKNISQYGHYYQVFVDTPIETCEQRDVKGLYKKARLDQIKLTGINDPFETPDDSEIILRPNSIEHQIDAIIEYLHGVNALNN